MYRWLRATALAAVPFTAASATIATAQSPSVYSGVDPYDVPRPLGVTPYVVAPPMWQLDPFGVGYDLLNGYRPIYSGARQPIGHEMAPTRADGNGYVYRPVYAPSPGYRYTPGGAMVVEYPTRHPTKPDSEFPSLDVALDAVLSPTYSYPPNAVPVPLDPAYPSQGYIVPPNALPPRSLPTTPYNGPREF